MTEAGQAATLGPSVSYVNSRWDLVRFQCWCTFRARPNQLVALLIPAATAWGTFSTLQPSVEALVLWALVTLLMLASLVPLVAAVYALSLSPSRDRTLLTTHTLTLIPSGVVEQTKWNRGEVYWSGLHNVVESAGYVYIRLTETTAHVVPPRAFATAQQRTAFVAFARQRMLDARAGSGD